MFPLWGKSWLSREWGKKSRGCRFHPSISRLGGWLLERGDAPPRARIPPRDNKTTCRPCQGCFSLSIVPVMRQANRVMGLPYVMAAEGVRDRNLSPPPGKNFCAWRRRVINARWVADDRRCCRERASSCWFWVAEVFIFRVMWRRRLSGRAGKRPSERRGVTAPAIIALCEPGKMCSLLCALSNSWKIALR
jgi:hypothetical protein